MRNSTKKKQPYASQPYASMLFPTFFVASGWYLNSNKVTPYTIGAAAGASALYYLATNSINSCDLWQGPLKPVKGILKRASGFPLMFVATSPLLLEAFTPAILAISARCTVGPEYKDLVILAFKAFAQASIMECFATINLANDPMVQKAIAEQQTEDGKVPRYIDHLKDAFKGTAAKTAGLLARFLIQERFGDSIGAIITAVFFRRLVTSSILNAHYGNAGELTFVPCIQIRSFTTQLVADLLGELAGSCASYAFKPEGFVRSFAHTVISDIAATGIDCATNLSSRVTRAVAGSEEAYVPM